MARPPSVGIGGVVRYMDYAGDVSRAMKVGNDTWVVLTREADAVVHYGTFTDAELVADCNSYGFFRELDGLA